MNIQNAQLNNSNNFVQNSLSLLNEIKEDENLSPLFNRMKKEDEKIYDAIVGFNIVKSLIEYGASWNKSVNWKKDEVYEVLQNKLDQIEKASNKLKDKTKQKLQSEVQKELEGYIDGGVHNVAIHGNYASITLKDTKKEFKISEFLNSDFCQKNGISGFSTLHDDGKSGMHGFVHNNIRHYVVTDGSYEMTLNWYVNGEKCTIKIKIDKEGVEFIEGNITQDQKDQLKANRDVKIGGLFLDEIQFRQQKEKENEVQYSKDNNNRSFETARDVSVQDTKNLEVGSRATMSQSDNKNDLGYESQEESAQNEETPTLSGGGSFKKGIKHEQPSNSQQKGGHQPTTLSSRNNYGFPSSDSSDFTKSVIHNQNNRQRDKQYDNPTFTTLGYSASESQRPDKGVESNDSKIREENNQPLSALTSNSISDSGYSSPMSDQSQSQLDPKDLASNLEEEKLNQQKKNKEHRENSKGHDSETHIVSSQLVDKESKNTQFASPADQAMDELKEVLKKPDKGLKEPKQQVTERNIYKGSFSENILQEIKEDKPIYKWLKDKIENKEDNQNLNALEKKLSQKSNTAKDSFSESILEKIKEDKPVYKWLKDKIEGKENNQNLNALDKRLSQKSGQGNIIEKRNDDDSKHLSPTSTGGDTHVSATQLQKDSRRSGKEPEEEERNFQKTKEALEKWKKKRLNKYGKINENIKKASFDTQEKTQPHHTNDLTPFEELTQRLSQKSYGLKQINPKARHVSPQTRKHLIEAGLLKDDSTNVKKVTEQENTDTNPATDKNRELHKLLEKDAAQLKVGVIEEEKEDTPTEYISSHDRNRIALSNKNKLLWTKHVKQQQEKDKDKGVSI
ncbi:hypothetical protein [Wolbachia endosymbiont of Ctenocephalides felis wCfeJ]|uniref:hypothetical protein n=1 Tax=Wolbachia endosymbiont of Ctenocephalides felis wCfeJ TaxID=2732594 RepID=UPI001444FE43|nr:hypothetical protein [Wolbachia endosymbiont of Ctenocephalides felis wCfeJ]WCR57539.1 MAG: hypothetical protein PG980_000011 [Wolbachia endosymbiont of Ctenocephalides felis wCfeJ]